MKFDKRYLLPALAVLFLLWLPFYLGDSSTTMEEMRSVIEPAIDQETYTLLDDRALKKYFHITPDEVEGYVGCRSKDTMSAETLLILQLKEQGNASDIKEKLLKYLAAEHKKYDGYSVDQVRILDNYTIIETKGYLYLSIVEDDSNWKTVFQQHL